MSLQAGDVFTYFSPSRKSLECGTVPCKTRPCSSDQLRIGAQSDSVVCRECAFLVGKSHGTVYEDEKEVQAPMHWSTHNFTQALLNLHLGPEAFPQHLLVTGTCAGVVGEGPRMSKPHA